MPHPHEHNHQHCIETALAQGEAICTQNGARLTRLRKHVLELVWQSHKPIKAYDLLAQIGEIGSATPPTVYRALDFLQANGLVHKINSLNAYVGCQHPNENHDCAFLICSTCHDVTECCTPTVRTELSNAAGAHQFQINTSHVEIYGTCANCQ